MSCDDVTLKRKPNLKLLGPHKKGKIDKLHSIPSKSLRLEVVMETEMCIDMGENG